MIFKSKPFKLCVCTYDVIFTPISKWKIELKCAYSRPNIGKRISSKQQHHYHLLSISWYIEYYKYCVWMKIARQIETSVNRLLNVEQCYNNLIFFESIHIKVAHTIRFSRFFVCFVFCLRLCLFHCSRSQIVFISLRICVHWSY